jgi:hypothetical protein
MMIVPFLRLRDWVNAAGLLLMLLAAACATPAPQVAAPPPGQVTGKAQKEEDENGSYLHRGIARRTFERRFSLADHMKVTGASLNNGLLSVDVVREVPEAAKLRTIKIGTTVETAQPQVMEQKAA